MDLASRRVFADELLERGDVWGEFIHLQCERRGGEQSKREYELEWEVLGRRLDAALGPALKKYQWENGFLAGIEFDVSDEPFDELGTLVKLPEAKWLQRLIFHGLQFGGAGDMTSTWVQLASVDRLQHLKSVTVDEGLDLGNPYIDGPIDIGDISPLLAAYPNLEVLDLYGGATRFDRLDLPRLESFSAWSLDPALVPVLAAANWPELRSLSLHFAGGMHTPGSLFPPLLNARMNDRLERISIASPWPAWFEETLPRSPLGRGRIISVG